MNSILSDVETILAEPLDRVIQRERETLERMINEYNGRFVLFGAGNLGRKSSKSLSNLGFRPLAFCDNDANKWGTLVEGVPVLSPPDAAAKYGRDAAFIITMWNTQSRYAETAQRLRHLGCNTILSASPIYWKFPSEFLPNACQDIPHKVYERADRVQQAAKLWADDESRAEFLRQLRWRAFGDFSAFDPPVAEETYFVDSLFAVDSKDTFIDCGAFDGDTIRSLMRRTGSSVEKVYAIEPDPQNYQRLVAWHGQLPSAVNKRVKVLNCAVGVERTKVRFQAEGTVGSMVTANGTTIVDCFTLDELLAGEAPSCIKMDIEGFELEALAGATRTIRTNHPILAICSYHKQSDLWDVPLTIQDLWPDYRLFLRLHEPDGWQLVTYAVPAERLKN